MLKKILLTLLMVILAAAAAFAWYMRPKPVLTVTSWAGNYGRAQASAQMRPFASDNRVDVHLAQWEGKLSDLKGDVIDFELPVAVEACQRGLIEKLDTASLPGAADGTPAATDFVPGAIGPCWVASIVYSQVILYAPYPGALQPTALTDFFDPEKFPGRRALKRSSAKYNLEMALLADGVPPNQVYATLSTDLGLARALHKLDMLNPNLVWYERDSEVPDLIRTRAVTFATALNGQLFDMAQNGAVLGQTMGVIWDRQLYEFDVFGIPAGNPNKELGMAFIRYATSAKALAGVSGWVPYGPARRSARPLVGRNPELGTEMTPFLPTTHFDTAFAIDDAWWRANAQRVDFSWRNWLADPAH